MKIGIITIHYGVNYGSALQAYALTRFLNENGFDAEIINYIPKRYRITPYFSSSKKNYLLKIVFIIARAPILFLHRKVFYDFLKKYVPLSKLYKTDDKIYKENFKYDVFITGSDQVWNKDYNGETQDIYYLNFAPKGAIKISCSASFGKSDITDKKELMEINKVLKNYKAISIRENSGLKILYKAGIKNAVQVLDPTFLYNRDTWKKHFKTKRLIQEPYILIYALDGEEEKLINYSNLIAKMKGYKTALLSVANKKQHRSRVDYCFRNKSPEYFIELFSNASYIVTNSFHGVAFSINFEKQFVAVSRKAYNSRLESILNMFNLIHRLINRTSSNLDLNTALSEINYSKIRSLIEEQRNKLNSFLMNNLKLNHKE